MMKNIIPMQYIYIYIRAYMYVGRSLCVCVCMYIYIYIYDIHARQCRPSMGKKISAESF